MSGILDVNDLFWMNRSSLFTHSDQFLLFNIVLWPLLFLLR
jgi:hypothetical protein